jgi:TonB family protein
MGVVTVRVELDSKGNVGTARVLRGVPFLDGASLVAARQWRFAEVTSDTPREVDLTFSFKLIPRTEPEPGPALFSLPSKVETREWWPEQ